MIRLKDRQEDDARDAHCYNDQHQRRCQLQRGQGHGKNGAAIEAGNEFKLSMKEFTIGSGKMQRITSWSLSPARLRSSLFLILPTKQFPISSIKNGTKARSGDTPGLGVFREGTRKNNAVWPLQSPQNMIK